MTFLTVGRCEFDDPPERLDFDGNTLRMSGDIVAASAAEMIVRRQQVLGLIDNPDEDVFPVTFTEDPTIDGWYRVRGASVGSRPTMFASYMIPWQLDLERLPGGSRSPQFEVYGDLALGTNSHSVTSATGVLGLANIDQAVTQSSGVTISTVAAADGNARLATVASVGTSGTRSQYVRWSAPVADYYDNTTVLEVLRGGTWYPVIGRQTDEDDGNWRIRNGLLTVTPFGTASISVQRVGGTAKTFTLSTTSVGVTDPGTALFTTVTVLRNDPWAVILRFADEMHQVDVTLRSGVSHVELAFRRTDGGTFSWVVTSSAETTTTTTGGIAATSADADGNKYVALCPVAVTTDTANRKVQNTTAATAAKFAIGIVPSADVATVLDHFLVNVAARQRVVSR